MIPRLILFTKNSDFSSFPCFLRINLLISVSRFREIRLRIFLPYVLRFIFRLRRFRNLRFRLLRICYAVVNLRKSAKADATSQKSKPPCETAYLSYHAGKKSSSNFRGYFMIFFREFREISENTRYARPIAKRTQHIENHRLLRKAFSNFLCSGVR